MSFFRRPHYDSEITQFINGLKKDQPDLETRQRAGRALLWDKAVDRSAWQEYREGQVPQKAYVYQNDVKG
ncbi:MAG: DUF3460 family protein [Burkholderiaceae bacterium]